MRKVLVGRIEYVIVAEDFRADIAARGLTNAAALMYSNGVATNLILRRPRGKVEFFAVRLNDGRIELRTRML